MTNYGSDKPGWGEMVPKLGVCNLGWVVESELDGGSLEIGTSVGERKLTNFTRDDEGCSIFAWEVGYLTIFVLSQPRPNLHTQIGGWGRVLV